MALPKAIFSLAACLSLLCSTYGMLPSPLLWGSEFGEDLMEMFGSSNGMYYLLHQLSSRLTALETNVRSGAFGGCESGVVGPLSSQQRTATITFQNKFLAPPSISLAISDLTSANAANPISFRIRPTSVTTKAASITFSDLGFPPNIASAYVGYMACPSNNSPVAQPGNTGHPRHAG